MDTNNNIIDVADIKKWVAVAGIVLCGTFLAIPSYDQALTSRHLIWCALAIVLVVCSKSLKVNKFAVLYLLLVFISCMFVINISEWIYSALRAILFVVFLSIIEVDRKVLAKTMISLGVIFTVYFWFDYFKMGSFAECRGLMRQRNYWAAAQFFVIPFCYYAFQNSIWKKVSVLVAVSMITNIILLQSRSVMLALLVTSLIACRKRYSIVIALIVISTLVVLMWNRLTDLTSLSQRLEQWRYTVVMIQKNPFGVGAGNWAIVFPEYVNNIQYPKAFDGETFRHPHNDFIWNMAEIGILGGACYIAMFITAIYSAVKSEERWLVMALVGYVVIASFSASHERAFASMIAALLISMAYKGFKVKLSRFIVIPLVFAMVVFGCRYRSSCYNKKLRAVKGWSSAHLYAKGRTVFSTMTHCGLPYYWWEATAYIKEGNTEKAIPLFEKAYKDNPYNVHVINGMGIRCALVGDVEGAKGHFNHALRICPEFEDAKLNLEKVFNGNKARNL